MAAEAWDSIDRSVIPWSDTPSGASRRATQFDVAAADRRRILGERAAGVYGFDLDVLTPGVRRIGPKVDTVHTPPTEVSAATSKAFSTETLMKDLLTY